jgi:hypothetical protein
MPAHLETEDCVVCGEPCDPDLHFCEQHVEEADEQLDAWESARATTA